MARALPALHHPRSPKPDARARTGNPSLRGRAGPRHWSRRAARASSLHELRAVWTLSFAASRHRFSGRFPRLRNGWNVSPVRLSDSLKNEGPSAGRRRSYLKRSPGGLIGSQGSPRCQGPSSFGFFGSRRGSSHLATCLRLCATRLVNVGRFRSRYRTRRVYAVSPIESPSPPTSSRRPVQKLSTAGLRAA